jgi:hypothetical protein
MTELKIEITISYFMTGLYLLKMSQFYYLIFASLVNSLIKLADEKGANKGALQKILDEETRVIYLGTGNPMFRGK